MIYNGRLTPPNNWPPLVQYPNYYPDRRLSTLWFLVLSIVSLTLSVIALIIVFAVESAWFRDSFENNTNRYGLWRLCSFSNNTCDSWFSTNGPYSSYIERRLNLSKNGINGWQALEIIFLFLTTATLAIAIASFVCYRCRNSFHYYLALLAIFSIWLAASVGVSSLFVFGFSVYNVAPVARDLDWCFYVNLVAVILVVLAAILLSIYDALLKKPINNVEEDTVVETFADLNGYPATFSPSTFVIVRRNRKKRSKPYKYPQVLYPNNYYPTPANGTTIRDYVPNRSLPPLTPYTSIGPIQETTITSQQISKQQQKLPSTPFPTFERNRSDILASPSTTVIVPQPPIPMPQISQTSGPFEVSQSPYQYQRTLSPTPSNWPRTITNNINMSTIHAAEPPNDYFQRDYYYPPQSNTTERRFYQKKEPRLLHYYTGYDYFATLDPSDLAGARHHPSTSTTVNPSLRYGGNSSYNASSDYIKSTL